MDEPHHTLILSRSDLRALIRPADYLAAAEAAFRALGLGEAMSPAPLHLAFESGGLHAKGAAWLARGVAAVKLNANVPTARERGLPTIQGAVMLVDARDGRLLAIMDSIEITLRRTAAATALAARHLASPDARRAAVCGCGAQASAQVEALRQVLPGLQSVRLWDQDFAAAQRLAGTLQGVDAEPVADLASATGDAEVIVTCTTARRPFLGLEHVSAGAFIAAVGADAPDKNELTPALMAASTVVPDVLSQALVMGDLHHAAAAGALSPDAPYAELADVVLARQPGRASAEEIVVFDSTGTGVQDLAAAAVAWERAETQGLGLRVALGV